MIGYKSNWPNIKPCAAVIFKFLEMQQTQSSNDCYTLSRKNDYPPIMSIKGAKMTKGILGICSWTL